MKWSRRRTSKTGNTEATCDYLKIVLMVNKRLNDEMMKCTLLVLDQEIRRDISV